MIIDIDVLTLILLRKMASSSCYNSPCAACKFLRRKCMPDCIFAPYFPPEEPQKFANVHKIFGASNVTKLLNELLPHQREDAVNSLAYEAEARVRDPVYGCIGAISFLQRQIHRLQKELDAANVDLIRYACNEIPDGGASHVVQPIPDLRPRALDQYHTRILGNEGSSSGYYNQHPPAFPMGYPLPWNENSSGTNINEGGRDDNI
ncbi:Protein LATERAL ORGAN BOUNDARIES, partial [Cucurbita argyrosperma subsp. argyrosperma]